MNIFLLALTLALSFRVTAIVDGRTLAVQSSQQSMTVRLAGIEAPDPAATAMLHRLTENRSIDIEELSGADGQLTGYVYRRPDGLFINVEMIHAGFATASRTPHRHGSSFLAAEAAARSARRGLWSANPDAADWESRFTGVRYLGEAPRIAPGRAEAKKPDPSADKHRTVAPPPKRSSKTRKKQ